MATNGLIGISSIMAGGRKVLPSDVHSYSGNNMEFDMSGGVLNELKKNYMRGGFQCHTHSRNCWGTLAATARRSRPRLGSRFARLGLEVGRGFFPRALLLDELFPLYCDGFGGSGLATGDAILGTV